MGQGVFFGLGAYSMAMHLTLETAGPDKIPTFMILLRPARADSGVLGAVSQ